MWRVTGFLIAVTSFFAGSVSGKCDMAKFQECGQIFSQLNPASIFSAAGADIVTMCQAVNNMTTCLSSLSSCGPEFEKNLDVVRMTTASIGLICKDDKSIQRFEEISTCFHANMKYLRECYDLSGNTEPQDIFTEKHCKEEETWSRCFISRIGEKCSKNSKDFTEEILGETERWLNKRCNPKVSIVTKKSSNGSRIHPQLWMILCIFAFPSVAKYVSSI